MAFWDGTISVVYTVKYLFNKPVEEWLFSDEIGIFTKSGLQKLTLKKLKYIITILYRSNQVFLHNTGIYIMSNIKLFSKTINDI